MGCENLARILFISRVIRDEVCPELHKGSVAQGVANLLHEVQVKIEVVDRDQAEAEDFFGFDEVTDIASGKMATG